MVKNKATADPNGKWLVERAREVAHEKGIASDRFEKISNNLLNDISISPLPASNEKTAYTPPAISTNGKLPKLGINERIKTLVENHLAKLLCGPADDNFPQRPFLKDFKKHCIPLFPRKQLFLEKQ